MSNFKNHATSIPTISTSLGEVLHLNNPSCNHMLVKYCPLLNLHLLLGQNAAVGVVGLVLILNKVFNMSVDACMN